MIEQLLARNCPKCQSTGRYWHQAGVFLVAETTADNATGGFVRSAAVVCPECGLIEFYTADSALLQELPQAQVPTEPHNTQ